MARKFRIPGLQIPQSADSEMVAFFNAVKERLELSSGERGDPESRAVTARELKNIGVIGVKGGNQSITIIAPRSTSSGSSSGGSTTTTELDYALLPNIQVALADADSRILIQGDQTSDRQVIRLVDLLRTFVRRDIEQEVENNILFTNSDGFEIVGVAPGFFFSEHAEGDGTEDSLPADTARWKVEVNAAQLTIYAYSDDGTTRTALFTLTRDAMDGLTANFITEDLKHNGSQVLVEVGTGLSKTTDTVALDHLGIEDLVDPNANRLMYWDNTANKVDWLDPATLPFKPLDTVLTPATITADQNDYAPTGIATASILRLASDTARVITGILPGEYVIFNVGGFNITLSKENALSVAANRLALVADVVIPPNGSATLWYDTVSSRHRCRSAVLI
jgi:hypothetical protein